MPITEANKLAQLSKPDILLKLFLFTPMPINSNSGLQHYCSRCCTSTAKDRLPALKGRNKRKENILAYGGAHANSKTVLVSTTEGVLI